MLLATFTSMRRAWSSPFTTPTTDSRACKLGNDDGCRALGFENYEKNIEIYEKFESIAEGCKFGNDSDCKLLKARIAEF